jgi:hypothetical protein
VPEIVNKDGQRGSITDVVHAKPRAEKAIRYSRAEKMSAAQQRLLFARVMHHTRFPSDEIQRFLVVVFFSPKKELQPQKAS